MNLPVNEIITTNYDYFLEFVSNSNFKRKGHRTNTGEKRHSICRKIETGGKAFWHIHGEMYCPASICLGYEHYCTYLSRMITFLSYPQNMVSSKPYLCNFLEKGLVWKDSWLTRFFTHDIYILGLSLSFIEVDLWWLFSYRMRFILDNPQYNLSNQIHYYYVEGTCVEEQLALLESMGIHLHPIILVRKNWIKVYEMILSDIQLCLNTR